jgi:hypothetical protein
MTRAFRRALSWGGSALLLMLIDVPSVASTFLAMDLPELVAESDGVVRGEVLSLHSFWDAQHRVILTDAEIRVDERLLGHVGQTGRTITVRTFGGVVGDYTVVAHGFPQFTVGEDLVLFLQRAPDKTLRVTGYQLGQYEVVEEKGVPMVLPTREGGATLLMPDGKEMQAPVPTPLGDFRQELRYVASTLETPL